MIILPDGKKARNLEEQVRWNQEQIELIKLGQITLAEFGIKVIGYFNTYEDLEREYPTESFTGDYGMACGVGTEAPFEYYVWTRTNIEGDIGAWINIGEFPQPGPTGATGATGPQGPQGTPGQGITSGYGAPVVSGAEGALYVNLTTGALYKVMSGIWAVVGNIQGPQGPIGPQGPKGDTGATGATGAQGPKGDPGGNFNIAGILSSASNLPTPASLQDTTVAYLVGPDGNGKYELYIQVGTDPNTAYWQSIGYLNTGTYVTVNGVYQNTWDADTKLDKYTETPILPLVYGVNESGTQMMFASTEDVLPGTIVKRDTNGRASINDPTSSGNIANKNYVDSNLPTIIRG